MEARLRCHTLDATVEGAKEAADQLQREGAGVALVMNSHEENPRTFTRWWVENYLGWGRFRNPATFPYPVKAETMTEKLNTMNSKLRRI